MLRVDRCRDVDELSGAGTIGHEWARASPLSKMAGQIRSHKVNGNECQSIINKLSVTCYVNLNLIDRE